MYILWLEWVRQENFLLLRYDLAKALATVQVEWAGTVSL
jgi:hypothetical protein